MSFLLTTNSTGTNQNITSLVELATYTASAAQWVAPSIRLSALNGAAATITLGWRHYAADGTTLIREQVYAFAKPQTTSTVAGYDFLPVLLANGEKLTVCATSTNGSDTTAAFTISWANGAASDVRYIAGAAAAVPGASGGLLIAGSNAATTFATMTVTGAVNLTQLVVENNANDTVAVNIVVTGTNSDALFIGATDATSRALKIINTAEGSPNAITVSGGVSLPNSWLTAAHIATSAITADKIAADALDGKGDWTTTAVGDGSVTVNEDTGGSDNLRVTTAGGVGVDNVIIRAYVKTEYDAGYRTIRGQTTTNVDGRWREDMHLDPATYTLTFSVEGYTIPNSEVSVA